MKLTPHRITFGLAAFTAAALLAIGSCTESPSQVDGVAPPESPVFARGGAPATGVQRVTVAPSTSTREVGQTVQLTATALDKKGSVVSGVTFTWGSSAPSVATVNASGLVTAVAAGMATITATGGGKNGNASVTVNAPPPPPPPPG